MDELPDLDQAYDEYVLGFMDYFDRISNVIFHSQDLSDADKVLTVRGILQERKLYNLRRDHALFLSRLLNHAKEQSAYVKNLELGLGIGDPSSDIAKLAQERDEANQKWRSLKSLIPQLLPNLDHRMSCSIWGLGGWETRSCTCGMDELRKRLTDLGY